MSFAWHVPDCFQLQIYAYGNYNIIYFEQKKPTVKHTFDLRMLCILFFYSYPVIRAVKGLQGKEILLQIKDIAAVIFVTGQAGIIITIPDEECNQDQEYLPLTPNLCTEPPLPSVRIGEEIFTKGWGVCTQAIDTQPPPPPHHQEKMPMNSRLQWCIYGYSFSMPG